MARDVPIMLGVEECLANERDDAHQRVRIGIAAAAGLIRKRHVHGHRRLDDDQTAALIDDVADLRIVGRRGHVHQRALTGDHIAGRQRQHRRDARGCQPRQLRIVYAHGVGGARLRLQNLDPLPALELRGRAEVLRRRRDRLIGGARVAEIDQSGIHRQPCAVDDCRVGGNGDRRAHGVDGAAANDDGPGVDRRTGGGDDASAADGVDVRGVGAKAEGERENGEAGEE